MDLLDVVDDVLEHHGTKGMRWGVRKETEAQSTLRVGSTEKDFKDARVDAKWLQKTHGANLARGQTLGKTTQSIMDDAIKSMQPEVKALNKSPEFSTKAAKKAIKKEKGFLQSDNPIALKYNKEVSDIYMKHIKNSASKHLKVSPSGKWEDELKIGKNYWYVGIKQVDQAKHTTISDPDFSFVVRPIYDEDGYIVDFEMLNDRVNDFLSHHGIKGMRWGIRRSETAGSQEVIVSDRRKRIKTTGGVGVPAHPDAIKVSKIGQVQRKSGTKALSNQELQDYTKRLQLEQNAKRLAFQDSGVGKKFVLSLLGQKGGTDAQGAANDLAAKQVKKHLGKLAIAAAV